MKKLFEIDRVTNVYPVACLELKTNPFVKDDFFKKGQFKFYFWDDFNDLVLENLPQEIPAFKGKILKNRLLKRMSDSEILAELPNSSPFSIEEFASIIKHLLEKNLAGYFNVFYIQLKNQQIVTVDVHWNFRCNERDIRLFNLGDYTWREDSCVFSRTV